MCKDCSGYNSMQYRVIGYLAERLNGIYITYLRQRPTLRVKECQRVLFSNTDTSGPTAAGAVPIALILDENDDARAEVTPESIALIADPIRCYDIEILHIGLSAVAQMRLNDRFFCANMNIRFIDLERRVADLSTPDDCLQGVFEDEGSRLLAVVSELERDPDNFGPTWMRHPVSLVMLMRFFLKDCLGKYEKVICIDSHTVFLDDPAKLLQVDLAGKPVGAVRDIGYIGLCELDRGLMEYTKDVIGLKQHADYFHPGVMLLDLTPGSGVLDAAALTALLYAELWRNPDTDLFNRAYDDEVCYLDWSWNVVALWRTPYYAMVDRVINAPVAYEVSCRESHQAPRAITYMGPSQPWYDPGCDMADRFWEIARQTSCYEILLRDMDVYQATKVHNLFSPISPSLWSRIKRRLSRIGGKGEVQG